MNLGAYDAPCDDSSCEACDGTSTFDYATTYGDIYGGAGIKPLASPVREDSES